MVNFKVIDCGSYIYISSDEYRVKFSNYLFDGKAAEPTNKSEWYRLDRIPVEVSEKKPAERINIRYELKAGYQPTELLPSVITPEMYENGEYDDVLRLYTFTYDTKEGEFEPIDFQITTIYKREDFTFVPNKYCTETDLLTQIEYPEIAYQDFPCKISSARMYSIIRTYVKNNIDMKYAQVTSDYDFHFEVQRRIPLADPYVIQVDENNSMLNKRRKPKWVSKTISEKKATILNIVSSSSDVGKYGKDCQLAPSIVGENYADLAQKVDVYLKELMANINKNYCECPHCKGWGVVEV